MANKSNSFIISSKGFLTESRMMFGTKQVVVWSDNLREARRFTNKQARNLIKKLDIECFQWNPYVEEPVKNKWEVVRRTNYNDWMNEEIQVSNERNRKAIEELKSKIIEL